MPVVQGLVPWLQKIKTVYDAAMKFAQARLSPPGLAQIMGEAAVDLPDNYFDAPKAEYLRRRNLHGKQTECYTGCFLPATPAAHFMPWLNCRLMTVINFANGSWKNFHFNSQTVMLAPATGFYGTAGLGKNEVRLAYVLNMDALNAAMDCLEKALELYPGKIKIKKSAVSTAK